MGLSHHIRLRQRDLPLKQRWPLAFLRQIVSTALTVGGCTEAAEVSVTLTGDGQIQRLNRDYRNQDKPTDVLSFALEEGPAFPRPPGQPRWLGDVVVSLDTTCRQAEEGGNDLKSELSWVLAHGTLHLLGFDHQTMEQLEQMRALERLILERLQVGRTWPQLWPEGDLGDIDERQP